MAMMVSAGLIEPGCVCVCVRVCTVRLIPVWSDHSGTVSQRSATSDPFSHQALDTGTLTVAYPSCVPFF